MNSYIHDIEILKKEVWFLKNKIKLLVEEISGITGGTIEQTLLERLTALENGVSTLENSLKSLELEVDTNTSNIADISVHIGELSTNISSIQENISLINKEIVNLKATDELLSGNINSLSDSISSINEEIDKINSNMDIMGTNIADLAKNDLVFDDAIEDLGKRVTAVENQVSEIDFSAVSGEIQSLKAVDEELSGKITQNTQDISNLSSSFDNLSGEFSDFETSTNEKITALESADAMISSDLNALKEEVGSMNYAGVISTLNQHEDEINYLDRAVVAIEGDIEEINTTLSGYDEKITSVEGYEARITAVESGVSQNSENVTALQERVGIVENSISDVQAMSEENSGKIEVLESSDASQTSDIASITQTIANLQQEIETLKSQSGGGGSSPKTVVVYDKNSEDEAINLGYPDGIVGYSNISIDLSAYSRLRIYATLYNMDCQREIVLANRNKNDVTFFAMFTSGRVFMFFKAQVPPTLARFQTAGYGRWTWDPTTSTLSVEEGKSVANVYIYRIEGIID